MGFFCPGGGGGGGGWWLIFGPRIFWVLLEPLGMFLGFDPIQSSLALEIRRSPPPPWEPSEIIAEDNSY